MERAVAHYGTVAPLGERASRLEMHVDTLDWPAMVLASVGAPFVIHEPSALGDEVARIGALFPQASA